jgi:hypothetical protein
MVIPKLLTWNEILWIYFMAAICIMIKVSHFVTTLGWWVKTILVHNFVVAMLTKFQHLCMSIMISIEFLIYTYLLFWQLDRGWVFEFFNHFDFGNWLWVEYQSFGLWNSTHADQNLEFLDTWAERYEFISQSCCFYPLSLERRQLPQLLLATNCWAHNFLALMSLL